ncbi:MAG: hypothetical protein ACK412_10265 [Chloroherpetonaceae bacterium]
MKLSILATGLFAALFFTGCAQIRQSAHEQSFARIYNGSFEHVFETTLSTLQSQGFSVALADKQRGIIQTNPVKIDEQMSVALFDNGLNISNHSFSIRLTVTKLSDNRSQLSVDLLSGARSNGILEQTLLNTVAVKMDGGKDMPELHRINIANLPIVNVLMKDHSTIEGYLLDDTQRTYLRLKLKSGGIMHIERSDIERYTLANESAPVGN